MRKILIIALVVVIALIAVVPVLAHGAPPCNDSGEPGNSDYARHHISFLAQQGKLGNGPSGVHVPGVHQGFSVCDPSGG